MQGQIEYRKTRKIWKTQITGIFKFCEFEFLQCLVQSVVKKIILVKSSLCEVRFNPCEGNQCDHSFLDIFLLLTMQFV